MKRPSAAAPRTGLRRAAILMVALDPETGGKVFHALPEEEREHLSQEIAALGVVGREEMLEVLEEFRDSAMLQQLLREGGYDSAIELIRKSLPEEKAARLVRLLEAQRQSEPFHFLEHAESDEMASFLQEEHPQTIALVLSYMQPAKAAGVLTRLPTTRQADIVRRIATLGRTSPEAIQRVEAGLRQHFAALALEETQEAGGIETVSVILDVLDRSTERAILEAIEEEDVELAQQIKKRLFAFEDLILVDDRGMQRVLEEVDDKILALALRLASDELKGKIFQNMAKHASEMVQEEIQTMGPVRVTDVEGAQSQIVEIVRRLEESGDVVVQGRGGERNLVV